MEKIQVNGLSLEQRKALFALADTVDKRITQPVRDDGNYFIDYYSVCFDGDVFGGNYKPKDHYKTVTFKDMIQSILDLMKNKRVTLNSEYTAEIIYDKKEVKVGCQTFPFSKIEELYKAIQEAL